MKHLLLSLTLIISANAWAGICDGPSANKPDYKEYCEKKNPLPTKSQTSLDSTKEVSQNKEGLCFGPRGQYRENEEYCSKQEGWVKEPEYVGDYLDGKRHGQGIYKDKWNGSKYVGDFRNGKKHGYGTEYYESGDIYQGEFFENKANGNGLCKFTYKTIRRLEDEISKRKFKNYFTQVGENSKLFECTLENNKYVKTNNSGDSWLSRFASGFVEGLTENLAEELVGAAIEGAILGSMMEPCVPDIKVRTSQTVAGAPQYGTKTRTTIKPCASAYQFK